MVDQCEYNMLSRPHHQFIVWSLNKADKRYATVTRSGISVREGRTAYVATKRSRKKRSTRAMTTTILGEDVAMITGVPPTITADRRNPVRIG